MSEETNATSSLLIPTISAIIAAFVMVVVYHVMSPKPARFAVVDLQSIYKELNSGLANQAASSSTEEGDKQKLPTSVQAEQMGKFLKFVLKNLSEECNCTLLVSGAVIENRNLDDYTDLVRQRLREDK